MKNLTTFYIVRHGETVWNIERKLQGLLDSPLTKNGISQAKIIAKDLSHISFSKIYSSDLNRAKHTAQIIAKKHKLAHETSVLLREKGYGIFEGKNLDEYLTIFKNKFDVMDKLSKRKRLLFRFHKSIETDEQILNRFKSFIKETAPKHSGEKVLVISHGTIMRLALIHLGFAEYHELPGNSVKNTGWFTVESDGENFEIKETVGITKIRNS